MLFALSIISNQERRRAMIIAPGAEKENCEDGEESKDPGNSDRDEKSVGRERELCPVLRQAQHPLTLKSDETLSYLINLLSCYSLVPRPQQSQSSLNKH